MSEHFAVITMVSGDSHRLPLTVPEGTTLDEGIDQLSDSLANAQGGVLRGEGRSIIMLRHIETISFPTR